MSSRPDPAISVIIPTFNRSFYLEKVLEALLEQDLDKELFELIVIDDGSRDETLPFLSSFSKSMNLRYVRKENAGLATAKNLGIYMAKGEILLFLDDDDMPTRSLLSAHLTTHRKYPDPSVAVLGYTEVAEELKADPLLDYVCNVGHQYFSYSLFRENSILDWQAFWGGRTSVKRSFLIERGVFNPVFRFLEDIELGWRLSKFGLKVLFNKKAKSILVRNPGFEGICQRERNKGKYHFLFSYLYRDEEIKNYSRIGNWQEKWLRYAPFWEKITDSAKKLHECLCLRIKEGQSIDEHKPLLYEAYRKLLECYFYKGVSEGPQLVLDLAKKGYLVESHRGKVVISFPDQAKPFCSTVSLDKKSFPYTQLEEILRIAARGLIVGPGGEFSARAEIDEHLALYLWEEIPEGSKTIEVDGVVASLIFLHKNMDHTALFSEGGREEIFEGILKSKRREENSLKILRGPTEQRLAELKETDFDVAVIHAKKGFPYPFTEFLFLSKLLKEKGLFVINDILFYGTALLCQYLFSLGNYWKLEKIFSGSVVFRKLKNLSQEESQAIQAFDLLGMDKHDKNFTLLGPYWRETILGSRFGGGKIE
ncbi:glycosyltransferase family 2 protein [Candidatus Methylacidiphilum infernorum]|uniref:Glycosyltransferase family 2 protein n=1 Tax=Candidatus Methylacidiphilum infernorum TaxID=511746 RepID=A0ABX7PXD4_9BACT|nr:glycosyltransferase family 2 protein [Candidatus Methylacidiphilum infernorum]QSR87490.1 glycosyltransferase family 2 protein [Candidatus Methylacidiphilum infernorum]